MAEFWQGKYKSVVSSSDHAKYEKLFQKFDEDGDGLLTSAEVASIKTVETDVY